MGDARDSAPLWRAVGLRILHGSTWAATPLNAPSACKRWELSPRQTRGPARSSGMMHGSRSPGRYVVLIDGQPFSVGGESMVRLSRHTGDGHLVHGHSHGG